MSAEEQGSRRSTRAMKVALPTAAALGAGAAVAAGAISSGGTISGCYVTDTGTGTNSQDFTPGYLRIVTSTSDCKDNEASLTWNQQGPPGQKGDQGIQGIQGLQGIPGQQGKQGPQGKEGSFDLVVLSKNSIGTLKFDKLNIPITSLDFLGHQTSSGSLGGGAGKSFERVAFATADAKVFPTLQKDVAFGTTIKSIELSTHNAKGIIERFELRNAMLTSFQLGGSSRSPLATVDLQCTAITANTSGKQKTGPTQIQKWNVSVQKAF